MKKIYNCLMTEILFKYYQQLKGKPYYPNANNSGYKRTGNIKEELSWKWWVETGPDC